MSSLIILGATGSLGSEVLRQALDAHHDVTAVVRTQARLSPEVRDHVSVLEADLTVGLAVDHLRGHDALICCAGHVNEGDRFVGLIDRVVSSVENLSEEEQPVCWFLAGAALLEIDPSGRRGVDFPEVRSVYWPHDANFVRLVRSRIDWRLLCPGPMVAGPQVGLQRMRVSVDEIPVQIPAGTAATGASTPLSAFVSVLPEMIVPYADAAALMLAHLARGDAMSRHRVGLALPVGMRGSKP